MRDWGDAQEEVMVVGKPIRGVEVGGAQDEGWGYKGGFAWGFGVRGCVSIDC